MSTFLGELGVITPNSLDLKVSSGLCDNERQRTHKVRLAFWVHVQFFVMFDHFLVPAQQFYF